ncbi:MAG: HEAT repeat domain-containing protein [Planctomycetota bacterium]|nr:HEAT repeat domain-containing protein [Planctomycetota bacterium]
MRIARTATWLLPPVIVGVLLAAVGLVARADEPPREPQPTIFADDLLPFGTRRLGHDLADGDPERRRRDAVEGALAWLAANQADDGRWRAANDAHDVGVTGLAVAAFLQAGYTHRGVHPYARSVRRGLRWLAAQQQASGCFGPAADKRFLYDHAFATHAVVSAYGMTGSPILRRSANVALDFARDCRNPRTAWSYGIRDGKNDTTVTGSLMLPFVTAQFITLASTQAGRHQPFPAWGPVFGGTQTWFKEASDIDSGRVGYRHEGTAPQRYGEGHRTHPVKFSECPTAIALLFAYPPSRPFKKDGMISQRMQLLFDTPPQWLPKSGSVDLMYWWFGCMAMARIDGKRADEWIRLAHEALLEAQHQTGEVSGWRGSWDPIGAWGSEGGRVYATAVGALILTARAAFPWGHSENVSLTQLIGSADVETTRRHRAMRAAAAQPTRQATNGALLALADPLPDIRRAAVVALGRIGTVARSKRVMEALVRAAVEDDDLRVQRAAVWAIGRVGQGRRATTRTLKKLEVPADPGWRFVHAVSIARVRGKPHPGLAGSLRHVRDPELLLEAARERGLIDGIPATTDAETDAARVLRYLRLPVRATIPHTGAAVRPLSTLDLRASGLTAVLDGIRMPGTQYADSRQAIGAVLRTVAPQGDLNAATLHGSAARLVLARHARALMLGDDALRARVGVSRQALWEHGRALASRARTELDALRAGWDGPEATAATVTAALLWLEADYLWSWFGLSVQGEDRGLRDSFAALDEVLWRWDGTRTARSLVLRKAALLHDFAKATEDDEARAALYEGVLLLYADAALGDPRDLPDRRLTTQAFAMRARICLEARRVGRFNFLRRGREIVAELEDRVPHLGMDPGDVAAIVATARLLNRGGDQNRALALLDRTALRAQRAGHVASAEELRALRERLFRGG